MNVESLLASPATPTMVLSCCVVPGGVRAAEARALGSAPGFGGVELPVSGDRVIRVDGARVVSADMEASNGLIHVIDRVLVSEVV